MESNDKNDIGPGILYLAINSKGSSALKSLAIKLYYIPDIQIGRGRLKQKYD
jgi:hypothetical protein